MLTLKRIAVTGSIASGKSTVCQFFERWGACVVSADYLLHRVFTRNTSLGRAVVALFGEKEIVTKGKIDRTRIAEAVRSNPTLLDQLEDICHPYVNQEILQQYKSANEANTYKAFVAEIPLLFESRFPLRSWFDVTIVVVADEADAQERYVRNGGSPEQFAFRLARQLSIEDKVSRADYVLYNDGTIDELETKAHSLFETLFTGL